MHYDRDDEIIAYAQSGKSASWIQEHLGLPITVRQVQRLIHDRLGPRPTRAAITRPDLLRSVVLASMKERGLNEHWCSVCGEYRAVPCLIRCTSWRQDVEHLVFVCRGCSAPGDV